MATKRITQREIAKLAGVSQVAVSMVINDPTGVNTRISAPTRQRIQRAIHDTGYVVDAAARRLAGLDNRIVGVFTYEHGLSPQMMDFYGPLLNGLETAAELFGCDLLFFTGTPVEAGSKRIFSSATRLRLADGCILLGKEMHSGDLNRLVREDFPFVAVGRRDEPGVPYVGIDYVSLTGELIQEAVKRGHARAVYVHQNRDAPSSNDRLEAVLDANSGGAMDIQQISVGHGPSIDDVASQIVKSGVTLAIVEDLFDSLDLAAALAKLGAGVPDDISLVALAEVSGHTIDARQLSGFNLERQLIASEALELLQVLVRGDSDELSSLETQRLLVGTIQLGQTLTNVKGDL